MLFLQSKPRAIWWLPWIALLGCGASPRVQTTADYQPAGIGAQRVAFVPLAVTDELGDDRTGIVLSDWTRGLASTRACERISQDREGRVVCFGAPGVPRPPDLAEVERLFALDQPIPKHTWQKIRKASRADYALLFRPESVASSRSVNQELRGVGILVLHSPTTAIVSTILSAGMVRQVTARDTEVAYTLSASLVDLRSGKVLKVGVHSGSDSREVTRDLGYAEPPPAAPILEEIMVDLGEEVLED